MNGKLGNHRLIAGLLVLDVALLLVSGIPAIKHADDGWRAVVGDVAWIGFIVGAIAVIVLAGATLLGRKPRLSRTGVVAGVVAAGVAVALGSAGALLASPSHVTRMHLVEVEVATNFVDLGKPGLSQGDRHTIMSDIFDEKHNRVGRADFDCIVTGVGKRIGGMCNGVLTLPKGQLTGQSAWGKSEEAQEQAITGGTGAYAGARGQFVIEKANASGTPFVVELRN